MEDLTILTTPTDITLLGLAGLVTGVLGAILGTGGGVFLVPVLVLGFGIPMHYALGTSIMTVIATSSAVAGTNVERGTANMRLGMTLEIATALGAITGGAIAGQLSPETLQAVFAIVLLPTAWLMWTARTETTQSPNNATVIAASDKSTSGYVDGQYLDEQSGQTISYHVERLWGGMLISFLAGNFSGLLGIGGGVFKVPALHLLCAVPIKAAAATSNFMIGVTAAASAFLYFGRGEVIPTLTGATVLGVLVGSAIGVGLNRRVQPNMVRRLFAVLLVAVSVQMGYRAFLAGIER